MGQRGALPYLVTTAPALTQASQGRGQARRRLRPRHPRTQARGSRSTALPARALTPRQLHPRTRRAR
eukprot:4253587-Alexandrium_andersonii.AAC.1